MEFNLVETIQILLVEDNPGDIRLTVEALKDAKMHNHLHVVNDGIAALSFLERQPPYTQAPRPDLILLDLNLPKMDGREVLEVIKSKEEFKRIPVVILTTSNDDKDILASYNLHANCYITKPVDLTQFLAIVKSIQNFWFSIVKLPPQ